MEIRILDRPFDPLGALADFQAGHPELRGRFGATASFIGTMRDYNEGDTVSAMVLEHYPGMTERHLERIAREAMERWGLLEVLIVHRVGELLPNDPIVLVAVWSGHRREAFEACRHLMEDLKSRAPFWKRESLPEGSRWVAKNTPG